MPKITGRGSRAGRSNGQFVAAKSRGGLFGKKPRWHRHRWLPWYRILSDGALEYGDVTWECSKCGKTSKR